MSPDTIYERVISYFEAEFEAVRRTLESGELNDFKERVVMSQKIMDALNLLSPYVRSEWRARQVVKSGEELRNDLLSVREIIKKKVISPFPCDYPPEQTRQAR